MKSVFINVLSFDELAFVRPLVNKDSAYIVNTAPSGHRGHHWLLIYFRAKTKTLYFFDSFGKPPSHYFISRKNITPPGWKLEINRKPVQAPRSNYCGLFVLRTLYMLSRGLTLKEAVSDYSTKNLSQNDQLLRDFARERLQFDARRELIPKRTSLVYERPWSTYHTRGYTEWRNAIYGK